MNTTQAFFAVRPRNSGFLINVTAVFATLFAFTFIHEVRWPLLVEFASRNPTDGIELEVIMACFRDGFPLTIIQLYGWNALGFPTLSIRISFLVDNNNVGNVYRVLFRVLGQSGVVLLILCIVAPTLPLIRCVQIIQFILLIVRDHLIINDIRRLWELHHHATILCVSTSAPGSAGTVDVAILADLCASPEWHISAESLRIHHPILLAVPAE